MLSKGTIVEVYTDPLTMICKEGNATIVAHVMELEPGVDLYQVTFIGDDPRTVVERKIAEAPVCCCLYLVGDNAYCKVHSGSAQNAQAHWAEKKGEM